MPPDTALFAIDVKTLVAIGTAIGGAFAAMWRALLVAKDAQVQAAAANATAQAQAARDNAAVLIAAANAERDRAWAERDYAQDQEQATRALLYRALGSAEEASSALKRVVTPRRERQQQGPGAGGTR